MTRKLSLGKIRGLQQISDAQGIFAMCAMDHRGSMQRLIKKEAPEQVERLVLLSIPFFGNARKARCFFSSQPIPYGWFFSNMALVAVICVITRRVFGWLVPYIRRYLPSEVAADIVKHSWRSFTSSFG